MSWTSKSLKTAAVTLALGAAGAALAGTIVVRSSGPSSGLYPPGRQIAAKAVTLREGDTLILLDGRGTRTLSGAGVYQLGVTSGPAPAGSALGALIRNTGARQVRTGAVRGAGSSPIKTPNLWYVDTARSGTICVADANRAALWRADMTQPATLTLKGAGGKTVPVTFAAGQSVRAWPAAELPIVDGSEYWVNGPGWDKPTALKVAVVGASTTAADEVAGALIARGCSAQVDLLVEAAGTNPAS